MVPPLVPRVFIGTVLSSRVLRPFQTNELTTFQIFFPQPRLIKNLNVKSYMSENVNKTGLIVR